MILFRDGAHELEAADLARFAALIGRLEPLAASNPGERLGRRCVELASSLDDDDVRAAMHGHVAALGLLGPGMVEEWMTRHQLELGDLARHSALRLGMRLALGEALASHELASELGVVLWRAATLGGEADWIGTLWATTRRQWASPSDAARNAARGWLRRQHQTASLDEIGRRLYALGIEQRELHELAERIASVIAAPPAIAGAPALPGITSAVKAAGDSVRTCTPEETWRRVEPELQAFGITRVADVTGLDNIGIPVWTAVRPASQWQITVHAGKGMTPAAARIGACAEAIECACAERPPPDLRLASLDELDAGGAARLDPRELELPAGTRFTPQAQLLWVPARDLISGGELLVPAERAFRVPGLLGLEMTSNGQASGNCVEEAIAHALAELVERDATMTQRFRWLCVPDAPPPPLLDLNTAPVVARDLAARFTADGVLRVLDLTSDLGVPVFLAVAGPAEPDAAGPDGQTGSLSAGSGCDPDAEVALLRAITEAAQTRAVVVQGSREDLDVAAIDRATPRHHKLNELGLHSSAGRLALWANPRTRAWDTIPSRASRDVRDDITWLLERLMAAGLQRALMIDLDRGQGPLRVVRMVVPGLQDLQSESLTQRARRALVT